MMTRLDYGWLLLCGIILLMIGLVLWMTACKFRVPPQPFWVLTLGLCIVSATLAVLGYENGVWVCLVSACVAFAIGCIATARKE